MRKKWLYGGWAALVALVVVLLLEVAGLTPRWNNPLMDWCARLMARPSTATPKVKLVLVDQSSLDWASRQMGWQWPWPREIYGVVLDYLKRAGAKAVVFDVLFTEPSIMGVYDDEALGAAIERTGQFVGAVFLGTQTDQTTTWPEGVNENPLQIAGLKEWLAAHPTAAEEMASPGAAFPIPEITAAADWLANVREVPDGDGIYRRVMPFRLFDGRVLPSLGVAGWLAGESLPLTAQLEASELQLAARRIPLDAKGRMILKFRGPSGTHEAYTASSVILSELSILDGQPPPIPDAGIFKDAYVVFGFSAPGLKDLRATPMGGDYPGPEIYATQLDNLLADDFLRDAPRPLFWGWLVLLALATGLAAVFSRKTWQPVIVALVGMLAAVGGTFAGWSAGWVWPMAAPIATAILALLCGAIMNFLLEGRQKRFIKGAFKHYLSADVIDQIMKNPDQLKLGGERRELTIFFSDLQGFSGISERLGPEELTQLLNDYLSDMTDILMEEGGTLDKYEGDAIIAFWNAPLPQADHAIRAVRAAVRCQQKLAARRREFEARTGAVLKMRIGINTGFVVVGNMGSRNRFDYTVLGDAANLASRLEGANKALGTYLMISESTWTQAAPAAFPGRELGELRVVGRQTPVRVFEALGLSGEPLPPAATAFDAALELVRRRDWAAAAAAFEQLAPEPAASIYAEKCRALASSGGAADWDGIWNLTEK